MKPYNRVTPIGVNTGKIIIGCAYIPKPKAMSYDAHGFQALLTANRQPLSANIIEYVRDQIKAKIRLYKAMTK